MDQDHDIIGNLKDAGCSKELIAKFMESYQCCKPSEQIRLLSEQRRTLLGHIHRNQKKLDSLDYLIYKLKKEHTQHDL